MKNTSTGRRLLWFIALGMVLALGALVLCRRHLSMRYARWGVKPFNAAVWRSADPTNPECIRGQMVWSLLRGYRLVGMTKGEVLGLLGKPDGVDHRIRDDGSMTAKEFRAARELCYSLGMWSGFRMDYDVLVLFVDRRNIVTSWDVQQW